MGKHKHCWLRGYGPCRGKLNGEHYISRSLLKQLAAGHTTAVLGGLPFQPPQTLEEFGIGSLTTRLYCEKHNTSLSPLDDTLSRIFAFAATIDKRPGEVKPLTAFQGRLVERALLKMVVGVSVVQGKRDALPEAWKGLLTGERWPEGLGLYLGLGERLFDGHFVFETKLHPISGEIVLASFHLGGLLLHLLLGKVDEPQTLGLYRARGFIFDLPDGERRLELKWPHEPNECVTLFRGAATSDESPYLTGWHQPG